MTGGRVRSPAGTRRVGWGWILASGILSVIIGGLALLWPFPATLAAALVTGAFFIAAGGAALASALGGGGHETRGHDMAFGWITLLLGCVLVALPGLGAYSLTLAIAIWLGARGAVEIHWGLRARRHRWPLLGMGATNILLDLFLLSMLPVSAMTVPGVILAISFLFGGLSTIRIALGHRLAPR